LTWEGKKVKGMTNAQGHTRKVTAADPSAVKLEVLGL
jgi:hypothetical protein